MYACNTYTVFSFFFFPTWPGPFAFLKEVLALLGSILNLLCRKHSLTHSHLCLLLWTQMKPLRIQLPLLCLLLAFDGMQTIVMLLGTGVYQCTPICSAKTRTVRPSRMSLGHVAALTLWLTGSPRVPNDQNKYMLYLGGLQLPGLVWLIQFHPFVPSHASVLIGDVYEQLPTIMVVKPAPLAWNFYSVYGGPQAWQSFCHCL